MTRSRLLARMMSRPQGAFFKIGERSVVGGLGPPLGITPPRMLFTSRSLLTRRFCTTVYTRSCGSSYAHYAHVVLTSIGWSITVCIPVARLLAIRRLFYHYYSQLLAHFLVQSYVQFPVGHFSCSLTFFNYGL